MCVLDFCFLSVYVLIVKVEDDLEFVLYDIWILFVECWCINVRRV